MSGERLIDPPAVEQLAVLVEALSRETDEALRRAGGLGAGNRVLALWEAPAWAETTARELRGQAAIALLMTGDTAGALHMLGFPPGLAVRFGELPADVQNAIGSLLTLADRGTGGLAGAGADALVALVRDAPSILAWQDGESLSDYEQRVRTEVLSRLPGAEGEKDLIGALVWLSMGGIPAAGALATSGTKTWSMVRYFGNKVESPLLYPGAIGGLTEQGIVRVLAGRFGLTQPMIETGFKILNGAPYQVTAGRDVVDMTYDLARIARIAPENEKLFHLTKATGILRPLGVAGSVAGTGLSLANVVSHGNPVDDIKRDATGYATDVAELGFNASMTAALICPNPVTIGAVIGTGAVYGGLELWNHREEIGLLAKDGVRKVGEVSGWADDQMDKAAEGVKDLTSSGAGLVKKGAGKLNPFD